MTEFVETPGPVRPLRPQALVLLDAATGLPVSELHPLQVALTSGNVTLTGPITVTNEVEIKNESGNPIPVVGPLTDAQLRASALPTTSAVAGSTGQLLDPASLPHTYGYTAGLLTTDTVTDGVNTWVKTYAYTSGNLTSETKWVKQ